VSLSGEMCYNPAKVITSRHAINDITQASKAIVRSALDIFPVRDIFWYTLRELMLHEAFYTA
jgi:hypothetical protein